MPQAKTSILDKPLLALGGSHSVEVEVLHMGGMYAPAAFVHKGDSGDPVDAPVPAFLVKHPVVGNVLIDTGLQPAIVDDPDRNTAQVGGAIIAPYATRPELLSAHLEAAEIAQDEIGCVVLTHFHWDHTGGLGAVGQAPVVAPTREWQQQIAANSQVNGYDQRVLDLPLDLRLIDLQVVGRKHEWFRKSFDLFKDGSVVLVATPGHSAGHMSVLLQLAQRELLICGDAAFTTRTIKDRVPQTYEFDESQFFDSLDQIRAFVEIKGSVAVPGHDRAALERLPDVLR